MTTLTIQVNDKDKEFLLEVLQRINAKIIKSSKKETLLANIKTGLKEAKEIKEGKIEALSLDQI